MANELNSPAVIDIDLDKMAGDWARYTAMALKESLNEKGNVMAAGPLMRSIVTELQSNGGNLEKVLTKFRYYGRFLDMGVGRGVSIAEAGKNNAGALKSHNRKPVKWFSGQYYHEVARFKEIYLEQFNKDIPVQIVDALTTNIAVNP